MIKAIIFDVGGVYLQGSFTDFVNKSYKILGINDTFQTGRELVFDHDYNRGCISVDECFRKYFSVFISDEQMEKIKEIWSTTWVLTEEMRELVRGLKNHGYRLAILSVSDLFNSQKYRERGWYDDFDPVVLSHEEGLLKPERRLYEITLERLGLPANECLFIDNEVDALPPAQALGMETIHFESIEQLKEEFEKRKIKYGR